MAFNLENTLVIGISATALFDLSKEDKLFEKEFKNNPENAIQRYREYMLNNEHLPLEEGIGFPLIKSLLDLNKYQKKGDSPLVEVVIMSRNSPDTGVMVLNNIKKQNLHITRSAFTAGESSADYLEAFDVDLFLTTNEADAQKVIDKKVCASAVLSTPPEYKCDIPDGQVRIAFDGDAVLFDESSELVYKTDGIEAFHENEHNSQDIPMNEGPFASFLKKLARLQERLPMKMELSPVRIALVTARNAPSDIRVIKTLRHWGVYVDEAFFLGGIEKSKILKAFKAHIFFDDQDVHLKTSSLVVPCGKVLYPSSSALKN
ncbi:5'-nucleotidase [Sulfurimonas gotlandica GD1]|uniref:5'-nucleotidase n=1 Tax=Sulfurimonas gotlandica (strain DSM 19862 / JCM 16533 / GD1) TaxID=929558 RepID=B6BJ94_SULGG|nr:5'-nucleotidase [Sulfurimonas gotlandica]EDZ63582.1 cytosolic 5'-nucleotidase 1A [Sulfurimonas gotlandica GD1]EHP30612.1 5'-nucleotidase [Sulfurimonas gotlandica GD1]